MKRKKKEQEEDRCAYCFNKDHSRYRRCAKDCGLTLAQLKQDIEDKKNR